MNHVKKVDNTFLVCNDNHLNNLFVYDHDTPNEILCHVMGMGIVSVIKKVCQLFD